MRERESIKKRKGDSEWLCILWRMKVYPSALARSEAMTARASGSCTVRKD
jgi:hypothetical protein